MDFRLANMDDLPNLREVYTNIIENMNKNNINIWDEIYPCELFSNDIINNRLYVLVDNEEIVSAFVLSDSNLAESHVEWESTDYKALYIDRFGVNVNYSRKGIGTIMLKKAIALANEKNAKYLRLFVVDINKPAINLYLKNGFKKVEGYYDEINDSGNLLHEFGFEVKTSI